MELRALTWNLFHGRDHPPNRELDSWRSRLWRRSEHDRTHVQVNCDLFDEFATVIAREPWDVALFQEAPPRWAPGLAEAAGAESHLALTSRNGLAPLRGWLARLNPDLIASNEGGSNLTLVRGSILDRRELELTPGPRPERRVMAFTRCAIGDLGAELCVANLHASAGPSRRAEAEREVELVAQRATEWAGSAPLLMGGDLNLRPRDTDLYGRLEGRFRLRGPTGPGSLDHLLARGLEPIAAARAWAPERREVEDRGLAIRLSDHAPVVATFRLAAEEVAPRPPGK